MPRRNLPLICQGAMKETGAFGRIGRRCGIVGEVVAKVGSQQLPL